MHLLKIENLNIFFGKGKNENHAVKDVSFSIEEGKTLAVVGESGSGKSVTAMSLTRLLPEPPTCRITGKINFMGKNILSLPKKELRAVRGKEIAYIFQEPGSSLNPVFTVGEQIAEAVRLHFPEEKNVKARVVNALGDVGIVRPEVRYHDYPHQLSGGMQQRVMIAMALSCRPRLLIADEPTTALDVTIQKQIMDLLAAVREQYKMSIMLITHNFGIVKGFADQTQVMFRGNLVESGKTEDILSAPQHPYTKALLDCIPKLGAQKKRLTTIDHTSLKV